MEHSCQYNYVAIYEHAKNLPINLRDLGRTTPTENKTRKQAPLFKNVI
jgi:hypothetical protein